MAHSALVCSHVFHSFCYSKPILSLLNQKHVDSITWHFHALFFLCSFAISGPSPSQKKTSFNKIVRKHKNKKEKPGAVEKGELEC